MPALLEAGSFYVIVGTKGLPGIEMACENDHNLSRKIYLGPMRRGKKVVVEG